VASPILLEGLRRLEYRGYDSAGVAVLDKTGLVVRKKSGKINEGIARLLNSEPAVGNLGIAHTRWATHGVPSDRNSHPHLDASGKIAVVHNGVIENHEALKQRLARGGHKFNSDTEVLAHLIGGHYEKRRASNGHNGDALTQAVGARRGSPVIIGIGNGEHFVASDANAIVGHTKKVVYLNDYDVANVTPEHFDVQNLGTDTANVQTSKWNFYTETRRAASTRTLC